MVISNKFLNAAEHALQERIVKKIFLELSNVFPEKYNADKEPANLKEIIASRKECMPKGIITEKGAFTWIALNELLGEDFFSRPEWSEYWAAVGKIGDYALGAFLNAINELFGIASPDDNGFGLSEVAFLKMPDVAAAASTVIIERNKIGALAAIEGGRQFFLETVPATIIKNPYNARISGLNGQIRKNKEVIYKTGTSLQEMINSMVMLEVENIELRTVIDSGEIPEDTDPEAKLAENEQKLRELEQKVATEKEKTNTQLQQLKEKNKGLRREVEQLKLQKN